MIRGRSRIYSIAMSGKSGLASYETSMDTKINPDSDLTLLQYYFSVIKCVQSAVSIVFLFLLRDLFVAVDCDLWYVYFRTMPATIVLHEDRRFESCDEVKEFNYHYAGKAGFTVRITNTKKTAIIDTDGDADDAGCRGKELVAPVMALAVIPLKVTPLQAVSSLGTIMYCFCFR